MAKKALVNTIDPAGKDDAGYRVLEVVESGSEFDVHPDLEWKDCPDSVESFKYWYDPSTSTFKKLPDAINPFEDPNLQLATDDDGNFTEEHVWDWDTESYSKQSIT